MKRIKNILLVSYIKNKGLRRLLFVFGIIWGLRISRDIFGIEKILTIILAIYILFFLACIVKWIISGFIESKKQK